MSQVFVENVERKHRFLVDDLCKKGELIKEELTPDEAHLIHMMMGICGETGELMDAVKKFTIYRRELDSDNVIEELGDIEFYMEGLRSKLGITREQVLKKNIEKLRSRYGDKYSDESAKARADKNGTE